MKKKLLTVALAATMAIATAITSFAETASTVDCSKGFAVASSGWETLSGDFDVTYTFHDKAYQGGSTFQNFIVEIAANQNAADTTKFNNYLTAVCNGGVWFWNDATATAQWSDLDGKIINGELPGGTCTDTEMKVMADADVTCNIKRVGEKVTINATAKNAAGDEATYTFETTNKAGFGDTVNVHLTGEKCSLTDVKFTNNSGSAIDSTTKAEKETTTVKEDKTTAATTTAKKTTASTKEDGGVSPIVFVVIAVVAVVVIGGVVVVVKKKNK